MADRAPGPQLLFESVKRMWRHVCRALWAEQHRGLGCRLSRCLERSWRLTATQKQLPGLSTGLLARGQAIQGCPLSTTGHCP